MAHEHIYKYKCRYSQDSKQHNTKLQATTIWADAILFYVNFFFTNREIVFRKTQTSKNVTYSLNAAACNVIKYDFLRQRGLFS